MEYRRWRLGMAVLLAVPGVASAALYSRASGQMYYDDVLNITWLADANYAKTSGYAATNAVNNGNLATTNVFVDGRMGWTAANTWADNLVYGGFDDWRLPTLGPIGSSFAYGFSNNATTDVGYAKTTTGGATGGWRNGSGAPVSEMGHMFYVNLANEGLCTPNNGAPGGCVGPQTGWSSTPNASFTDGGGSGTVSFSNVQSYYWSGLEYAPNTSSAWSFNFSDGSQFANLKRDEFFAWAVRPGDVAARVPEPATLLLLGAGLVGVAGSRRRARR